MNSKTKSFIISDEMRNIFCITKKHTFTNIWELISHFVYEDDKALVMDAHSKTFQELTDHAIEYRIIREDKKVTLEPFRKL